MCDTLGTDELDFHVVAGIQNVEWTGERFQINCV